jgi:hypothetical protein
MKSLILSFGEGVEVLHPKSLRDKIKKRVELNFSNYITNSADELHTKELNLHHE